jgi:hypothetical protein
MPSAMSSAAPQQRNIPAWKRLGLKLKFASEAPQPEPTPVVVVSVPVDQSKRKRELDDKDSVQAKKPKKSEKPQRELTIKESDELPVTPLLRRQKSVSFTPDTKIEDGDSIKQLFSAWVAEQKSNDPNFNSDKAQASFQVPEPSTVEEDIDPALDESERRVKRVKKAKEKVKQTPKPENNTAASDSTNSKDKTKKKPKKDNSTKPVKALDPALTYLDQFCTSKDSWKFNKVHQITLLKNAFSLKLIPSENIEQLYIYLAGLKGHARTVLRDAALTIKVKDMEETFDGTMEVAERQKRDYDTALSEYVATMTAAEAPPAMGYEQGVLLGLSDYGMKNRIAKRMRAERILAEFSSDTDATSGSGSSESTAGPQDEASKRTKLNDGGKVARKRKQRTLLTIDSSSSESSSDSDGSSSEEDSDDEEGPAKSKIARGTEDDTSSSSDSSSSESSSSSEDNESGEESSEESSDSE